MTFSKTYAPTSQQQIEEIESEFHVRLPAEYREFLLQVNGGSPAFHDYNLNGEYFDDIGWFFGIRNRDVSHDLRAENIEFQGQIPSHYFGIGVSYGGNVLCMSLKTEDFGSIFRWDHETANYGGEPWEDNMLKVADNFPQFLGMLYQQV